MAEQPKGKTATPAPKSAPKSASSASVESPAPTAPVQKQGPRILAMLLAVVALGLVAMIPLSATGLLRLAESGDATNVVQIQVLTVGALLLFGVLVLFRASGTDVGPRKSGAQVLYQTRGAVILNSFATVATALQIFLAIVVLLSLLAFVGVFSPTDPASIAVASNYLGVATFALVFLALMVMARPREAGRVQLEPWHETVAKVLIPVSIVVLLFAFLVSMGLLPFGPLAAIRPSQSIYIVTFALLLQFQAFRAMLKYPPLVGMAFRAVRSAKSAGKDARDQIKKRAVRAYVLGLLFVAVSMVLIGGVATDRLVLGEGDSGGLYIILYGIFAAIGAGFLLTRFLQQRAAKKAAEAKPDEETIGKKRFTKKEATRLGVMAFSFFFGGVLGILGLLVSTRVISALEPQVGTDLFVAAFLLGVGPMGFYRSMVVRHRRALDEKFPDLLRDLSESQRAGMTLPRALLTASKGTYGALTDEIRKMSAQVEWGVSFTDALKRFAARVGTPLIDRAVVLINEAASAGGNVVDILTAAADDAREIKQILEERKRQMSIYSIIIYIAFFVYLVVIFVLAVQFLPGFEQAVGAASGQQVGGLNLTGFDKDAFVAVFFHGALIQAVGGGLVAGVMTGGSANDGLKHSVILTVVSWVFFRLLVPS